MCNQKKIELTEKESRVMVVRGGGGSWTRWVKGPDLVVTFMTMISIG